MRKLILISALTLAGCATIQNPINTATLVDIESSYGVALSVANAYRQLYEVNRCTKSKPLSALNICASRSVVLKLQAADKKAQIALASARDFVKNYPTLSAASVIGAAELAVNAFKQIEQQNGVN